MGTKRFSSQTFSPFIVKFQKLGFSIPLMPHSHLVTRQHNRRGGSTW